MADEQLSPSQELIDLVQKALSLGASSLPDGPISPFACVQDKDNKMILHRVADNPPDEALSRLRDVIASQQDQLLKYVLVFDGRNCSPDRGMNGLFAEAADQSAGDHAFVFCQLFRPKGWFRKFRLAEEVGVMKTRPPSLLAPLALPTS